MELFGAEVVYGESTKVECSINQINTQNVEIIAKWAFSIKGT